MNTKERCEVYKIYNLPLSTKHNKLLLKYDLETEMLMVSKDRAKLSLCVKALITYGIDIIISFVIKRQRSISPMLTHFA